MAGLKIKTDDMVKVISGKDKGKTGRVIEVDPVRQKVVVEGVAIRKRHLRPRTLAQSQAQDEVGVVSSPGFIHVSNVMLLDPKTGDPTRIAIKREGGRRVRVAKKSGEDID